MAFRKKDPRARMVLRLPVSSLAITHGDLVKKNGTSNNVTNNVSAGDAVLGIADETVGTSATFINIDILKSGDLVVADVGSGTPAAGDCKSCDIRNSGSVAANLAVGTDSSHDVYYIYNGSTTTVDCYFHKLEVNTAA